MKSGMLPRIYDLLYQLGLTADYTGFFHTAYAVCLGAEDPERMLLVTKWLYPDVAKHYGTAWKAVERNIRTAAQVIWRENRPLLEELAGGPLPERPGNARLLAILISALDSAPPANHRLLDCAFPWLDGTGESGDGSIAV